jgi:hypothetical protein
MKAHKEIAHLTLTEDGTKLVEEKVQDRMVECWYDAKKKREEILKKLTEVKDALEQFQLATTQEKDQAPEKQTSQEKTILKQETLQIIDMENENLCITQGMLQVDEATM